MPVEMRADRHFLCTHDEFAEHAAERKQLRMEYFYRYMRRKTGILMRDGKPEAGKWNFDADNRKSFSSNGPEGVRQPTQFSPNVTTHEVIKLVEDVFANHPGRLNHFAWPVTPRDARRALRDFVTHRLRDFGTYQDTMWSGQPFLYHSLLSSALNLKLLDLRDVLHEVEVAYRLGKASLNSVEGFIRQILGWREYVRGVYWQLYWDFLVRHRKLLAGYQRMRMQLRNLDRKSRNEIGSIQHQAEAIRNQQS